MVILFLPEVILPRCGPFNAAPCTYSDKFPPMHQQFSGENTVCSPNNVATIMVITYRHQNTVISSNRKLTVKTQSIDLFCTQDQWFPRTQTRRNSQKFRHISFYPVSGFFLLRINSFQGSYVNVGEKILLIGVVKKYLVQYCTFYYSQCHYKNYQRDNYQRRIY